SIESIGISLASMKAGIAAEEWPKPEAEIEQPSQGLVIRGALASPRAKVAARLHGVDLKSVKGTGPAGLIIQEDVLRTVQSAAESKSLKASKLLSEGQRLVPFTRIRKIIARKMMEAKTRTAQSYMSITVNASELVKYRQSILAQLESDYGVRVTITDLILKLVGLALTCHPILNAKWSDDGVIFNDDVHIGVAVALQEGLVVPVIRSINKKTLLQVASERKSLVQKARGHQLSLQEASGGTFTVSSLGMYGIEQFTANLNVPESAILAVGSIVDKPVVIDGGIFVRPIMTLVLTYDHRIIDGAEAAKFLQTLKRLIESASEIFQEASRVEHQEGGGKKTLVVIGGGIAGYTAAIVAARMGAQVTLVERQEVGGVCLNWGCIPTKVLLRSCQVAGLVKRADEFGVVAEYKGYDYGRVLERKKEVIERLQEGVRRLLSSKQVRVINGQALMREPLNVEIQETGERIRADAVIIATGSVPCTLGLKGIDRSGIWDSKDFLLAEEIPPTMLVIGGGAVGVELAQIAAGFGAQVCILEMMSTLLQGADSEISRRLATSLKQQGIQVVTGAEVRGVVEEKGKMVVNFRVDGKEKKYVCDKVLVAVGRVPDTGGIETDVVGIKRSGKAVLVNDLMETTVPRIYAAGDVTGKTMLAHMAIAQGQCAAKNAMGVRNVLNYEAVPNCIYTEPEVAWVGMREEDASKRGDVVVGKFPLTGSGKAHVLGEIFGMVKVVADASTRRLLGVHIIGPNATELIGEAVVAVHHGMTVDEFAGAIRPHPTLSEAVMEAAMACCGGAIHVP
ncbi:MAG: dihydrolipoyl dehydrogenase, partial [Candidatus Methanomethylicaceae archaeon]